MNDVVVYTTPACPYCTQVKALLDERAIPYREIDLPRDVEGRSALLSQTGMMRFPQVLVGDVRLGGFQETLTADRSGRLTALVASVA